MLFRSVCTRGQGLTIFEATFPIIAAIYLVGIVNALGCLLVVSTLDHRALFIQSKAWIAVCFGTLLGMFPVWLWERITIYFVEGSSTDQLPFKIYLPWAIGGGICAMTLLLVRRIKTAKRK